MSSSLSPNGTVRQKLGVADPKATPFPAWLLSAVRSRGLAEHTLYQAWELVRLVNDATATEREALMALVVASLAALDEGSTRLSLGRLASRLQALGADEERAALARKAFELEKGQEIIGRPGDYKPLIVDGDHLYHQRVLRDEELLSEALRARLASTTSADMARVLDALDRTLAHPAVVNGRPLTLSTEQQHAIRTALGRPITLISGGPGTGKTSIVVSILRVLGRLDVTMDEVALAAPTGKAAQRVERSVRAALESIAEPESADRSVLGGPPEARTLHRLLGYSPSRGNFRHDAHHPLSQDVVIVDEASMMNLELMSRLLAALRKDAKLVLLGDADQLPSVEAGAVFRDLLKSRALSAGAITLSESYRMDPTEPAGRNILKVARHVNAVEAEVLFAPESRAEESVASRVNADNIQFRGVELYDGDPHLFLDRWYRERIATPKFRDLVRREFRYPFEESDVETLEGLFAHMSGHRILAVTNHDAERANRFLRRQRMGEPVMMMRNDYERGLFNGDQGLVLNVGAVFRREGGFVVFDPRALGRDVTTSYAITVHKSQGSELDYGALMLPEADHPLLTRELLYTALTRARKSFVFVGSQEAVISAIGRSVERSSGLAERLG